MFIPSGGLRINAPAVTIKNADIDLEKVEELRSASSFENLGITLPPQAEASPEPPEKPEPPEHEGDMYIARLVKLVPSEVVALYLAFKEVAAGFLGIWAAICLVLVLFVRTVGVHQSGKPIQFTAVIIAAISFILWVYAIGGYFFSLQIPPDSPGIVSVSVGVWTFIVPFLYRGD